MVKLGVYREDKRAVVPKVAYGNTSACFDLICIEDTIIPARSSNLIPNGLRITVPKGYYLRFADRSGNGIKKDLQIHQGIIDAGYAGQLMIKMFNMSDKEQIIEKGKGICQVEILKIPEYEIVEISEKEFKEYADNSIRGANGFGSSDKENVK